MYTSALTSSSVARSSSSGEEELARDNPVCQPAGHAPPPSQHPAASPTRHGPSTPRPLAKLAFWIFVLGNL
ncbi:hypothetical protein VDGD_20539 [Verticillium dahliae]|uniref:Uncharacterized protein n=1 Tax=Verticillium dahliae TaxID=27337 RepID=A0AA45ARX6_VERDA|nr:hypothetical protein BJF96_g249 [Verticillium dahliae]RBQ89895.1 hypothetical protein VDGD_20539 [Verticillium dahliae]